MLKRDSSRGGILPFAAMHPTTHTKVMQTCANRENHSVIEAALRTECTTPSLSSGRFQSNLNIVNREFVLQTMFTGDNA